MIDSETKKLVNRFFPTLKQFYINKENGDSYLSPTDEDDLKKRLYYFFNTMISNDPSFLDELINNKSKEEFAYFIKTFFDSSTKYNHEQWIQSLLDYFYNNKDYCFRDRVNTPDELNLNDWKEFFNHLESDQNIDTKQKTFIYDVLQLYSSYNPRRLKYDVPTSLNSNNQLHKNDLLRYYNFLIQAKNKLYTTNTNMIDHYLDIFLLIIRESFDEIINYINYFFDSNIISLDVNFLYCNGINDFLLFCKSKINDFLISLDNDHINIAESNYTYSSLIDMRKNMVIFYEYYSNLYRLKNITLEKNDNKYDFTQLNKIKLNINNVSMDQLKEICRSSTKCKDITTKQFRNHYNDIMLFDSYIKLNKNEFTPNLPSINFKIDIFNLLHFKVLYTEIFILKDELKTTNFHDFIDRNSLQSIMSKIIKTYKNKIPFYETDDIQDYYRVIYASTLYFTEKIRRGFYREIDKEEYFFSLLNIKMTLTDVFDSLIQINNIEIIIDNLIIIVEQLIKHLDELKKQ